MEQDVRQREGSFQVIGWKGMLYAIEQFESIDWINSSSATELIWLVAFIELIWTIFFFKFLGQSKIRQRDGKLCPTKGYKEQEKEEGSKCAKER